MKSAQGPFYLFLAFTLAGTSVIAARLVSGTLGTFVIAAASLFFALLFLLPLCRRQLADTVKRLSLKMFFYLFLQALFGIFLFRLFILNGLLHTSAGEAGLLTGATPAFTALLATVILKEPPSRRKLAGILSTVGGVLLIQGVLEGNSLSLEHLAGNLLVLFAAACESVFNILSRVSSLRQETETKNPMNPNVQTAIVVSIAFLLCLVPAAFDPTITKLMILGLKEWFAVVWYGAIVTAAAFVCWYAGIKRCGALTAAAFSGMMPLTALLLSAVLLHERCGWQQWTGGALVITGMLLIGSGSILKSK